MSRYPTPKSDEFNRTIRLLFAESPKKALEYAFKCGENSLAGNIWMTITHMGTDGRKWGRSIGIRREYLEGRNYEFSISDTNPVNCHIFLTEELYNPKKEL
jgi:hypothetical protein